MTINIIVADDSQYLRKSIADILKEHDLINIVDFAKDGKEAIHLVKKHSPDVLVLDLVMPKMNGLDAFKIIMEKHPTPTVILSAISPKNLDSSIQALLMGAFDYIIKPGGIGAKDLPMFREELLAKVLLASQSQIKRIFRKEESVLKKSRTLRQEMVDRIFDFGQYLNRLQPIQEIEDEQEKDSFELMKIKAILKEEIKPEVVGESSNKVSTISVKQEDDNSLKVPAQSISLSKSVKKRKDKTTLRKAISPVQIKKKKSVYVPDLTPVKGATITSNVIVMGASVGGPRTLTTILKEIPRGFNAPILIIQHLSSHFTEAFADNLNIECNLKVKVAKNGDYLQSGYVYIAPGDMHTEISIENKKPLIKIYKGTPVNYCMPSIDVLFFSAAKIYRNRAMGILLTGMGSDGVNGLGAIKRVGGKTIAESEQTSILYAMPKFAKEKGFTNLVLPNYEIKDEIIKFVKN
ncbi:MAG: chemotaxis-specific protein-glutamate methyltransferase CheB [Candidatus Lokiarchaeota archaeon]|nr:chemotaxis-specific protein-glutamate methyltransferase CheB [Candidatus Lokiarchaeota archaeon]